MSFAMDSYCIQCYLRRNIDLVRPLGPESKTTAFAKEIMKIVLAAPEGYVFRRKETERCPCPAMRKQGAHIKKTELPKQLRNFIKPSITAG